MASPSYGAMPGLDERHRAPSQLEVIAPYVGEFIGTFMLVFTAGTIGVIANPIWGPTAVAAVLLVMIYALGNVSGGHFNPALSVACGLVKDTPWQVVGCYILTQVGAGLLAGWAYYAVFDTAIPVGPKHSYGWFQVGIAELVYTAMLCFVFLNCVVCPQNNPKEDHNCFFGLAIGFVYVAGGHAAGNVSGGLFNPAMTLGLDVVGEGKESGWWRLAYVGYQLLGSGLACLLYTACRRTVSQGIPATSVSGTTLQVRVLAAYNLRNRDSGIGGDVSDPYVTVRVGSTEYRTPTINNNLNPIWISDNVFMFNSSGVGRQLNLEVLNDNSLFKNQSLGTCSVDLSDLALGSWQRKKERLVDGRGGELEFDVHLEFTGTPTASGVVAEPPISSRLCAEFLGTFVLVLTVGLNLVTKSAATPWSAGAALMCMVYSLGNVSGGHFNPAVTLGVVLSRRGKCAPLDGIMYILTQLIAGTLAGLLYADFHHVGPYHHETFGIGLGNKWDWWACFVAEGTSTLLLTIVVLAVATTAMPPADTKQNFYFGLAIGACVTAGGFAIGRISGGELNPAVSFGIATGSVVSPGDIPPPPWTYALMFSIFELAGGVAASLLFSVTHASEYTKPASLQF